MSDSAGDPNTRDDDLQESSSPKSSSLTRKGKKKHISMHEGIGAWADCCSCEAEPYWREHAEEMGVDFNDYEEDEFEQPDCGQGTAEEK